MKVLSALIFLPLLSGCGYFTPHQVANPSDVTVDNALNDVADGLIGFTRINKETGVKTGLFVDEIVVDFNVSASADGKLVLDMNNTASTLKANATIGSEAKRGNTVKVTLKNVVTANLNSVGKKFENGSEGGDPITTFGNDGIGGFKCVGENEAGKRTCAEQKSMGLTN